MKHIFVPLDIRNELETRFVDSDVLEDFKNMEILPISELVKKDLFDFLSFFPKCNLGAISNIEHSFLISPFKVNIADLELLDNLSKRFERTFGSDIVLHITMSEHTALLLNKEFWLSFVNNFNFVISDVWEPKFLHINEKLSMSNVFDNIPNDSWMYFVHSYKFNLNAGLTLTKSCYGEDFSSSISHENIFATQFHPEKSSFQGLKVLENFAKIAS